MKQQVIYELLDRVQMNAADRAAATVALARAEALASAVYSATQGVQAGFEAMRRGARALGERIRARFA
jgi:hypothetical protein